MCSQFDWVSGQTVVDWGCSGLKHSGFVCQFESRAPLATIESKNCRAGHIAWNVKRYWLIEVLQQPEKIRHVRIEYLGTPIPSARRLSRAVYYIKAEPKCCIEACKHTSLALDGVCLSMERFGKGFVHEIMVVRRGRTRFTGDWRASATIEPPWRQRDDRLRWCLAATTKPRQAFSGGITDI